MSRTYNPHREALNVLYDVLKIDPEAAFNMAVEELLARLAKQGAQLATAESTIASQLDTIDALTVGTDGSTPAIVQLARMDEKLAAAEEWAGHKFKEVKKGRWLCDCGKEIVEQAPAAPKGSDV